MKKFAYFPLVLLAPVWATEMPPVRLGGFIDTYYAIDTNNPEDHERQFTTQPVRHNEFNINLAFIEAALKEEDVRGRLALQYGNSVTKNTLSEPAEGTTSGPDDSKVFQEAYAGARLGEHTWLDMGIFLGNIGAESWISRDNWTYTRSMNLDYVPYYSSGVRLEHALDNHQTVQLQLLNGWQNMSENNQGKALGMQYKNHLINTLTFTYNNFFGDEEVVSSSSRFRAYHNFILQWLASDQWQFLWAFDVGHQSQQDNDGVDGWYTATQTIRRILSPDQAMAFRLEYYNDRHESNVLTNTPNGFEVIGGSVNFDQKLNYRSTWRTELRGLYSKDNIYPAGSNTRNYWDGFLVTSLSVTL